MSTEVTQMLYATILMIMISKSREILQDFNFLLLLTQHFKKIFDTGTPFLQHKYKETFKNKNTNIVWKITRKPLQRKAIED